MIRFKNSSDAGETEHDGPSQRDGDAVAAISSPKTPLLHGQSLSAPLCSKCILMTATAKGLRDLVSPEGYAHHNVSELQIAGEKGCSFCKSIFKIVSTGKLWASDPDGQLVRVPLDEKAHTSISAYCEGVDTSSLNRSNVPVLKLLKHIVVEFICDGRKCLFHVPVPGMSLYKDKILAFQAFTELSQRYHVCQVEVAGSREFVSFERRSLEISVTSEQIIDQSKRLLKECTAQHAGACPSEVEELPILPSRVLDVNSDETLERLGLHISTSNERAQYIALSYCWGDPPYLYVTTKDTLRNPSTVDWAQLPATIRDAITATRSLGLRYLWIDALCIVQDDEADKIEQIKFMGQIYKNATVTIAAASSNSVHTGFLEDRKVPSIPFPILSQISPKVLGKLWIHENTVEAADEPLDRRAWTLQEALLSPRVLYYGSKDLMWKCQRLPFQPVNASHNLYSKSNLWGNFHLQRLPSTIWWKSFVNPSQNSTSIMDCWPWIQSAYSERKLSLAEDRFRALGGIVEELQRVTGDTYIAGVWKNHIAKSLAWFRSENIVENPILSTPGRPSWSWLTLLHRVRTMRIELDNDQAKRLELLSWSIKLADETAPFGHIEGAELELSGYMIQTTKIPAEILAAKSSIELMVDFDIDDEDGRSLLTFTRQDYYCLLLGRIGAGTVALLLQSLVDGSFIRVGILVLSDRKSVIWSLEDAQRTKINLM